MQRKPRTRKRTTVPREQRPPARTIQPRYQDSFRQFRAEYCRMRPGFRSLSAVLRKVRAGGELSQRLPTLETLSVWARGGLYVPGCWESERPWNELAALVDSGQLSEEMLSRGTELAGQVLQLMEESLKDPQARRKLVQSPTLLLKFAQMVGKASLPMPVLEPAKPQEPELDPQTAALRAMSDEELYALIHGLDEQEKAELPSES